MLVDDLRFTGHQFRGWERNNVSKELRIVSFFTSQCFENSGVFDFSHPVNYQNEIRKLTSVEKNLNHSLTNGFGNFKWELDR